MACGVAEIRGETGVLSRDFAGSGPALCFRRGGEGEIPGPNALAGEIHRLPGGFLLSDVQPLPSPAGDPANGGGRAVG